MAHRRLRKADTLNGERANHALHLTAGLAGARSAAGECGRYAARNNEVPMKVAPVPPESLRSSPGLDTPQRFYHGMLEPEVLKYMSTVNAARGKSHGWPESEWQKNQVALFAPKKA